MFDKNETWLGLLIGALLPIVGFGTMIYFNDMLLNMKIAIRGGDIFSMDEKTLYVLGVCYNLIPFSIYRRKRFDLTMTAIIWPTLIYVGLFFVWYILYPEFTLHVVKGE